MPDVENGYTRIANELLEAVLLFPFTQRQQTIFFAVLRKTYGFNKKRDDITNTQLAKMTCMDLAHVGRTIQELVDIGALQPLVPSEYGHIFEVNKKYTEWIITKTTNKNGFKVSKTITLLAETATCQNSKLRLPKRQVEVAKTASRACRNGNHKRQPQKTTPKDNSKRQCATTLLAIETPENLNLEAWQDFVDHRKALRIKPYTAKGQLIKQRALAELEHSMQQICVDSTIGNNYQGLFPEKFKNTNGSGKTRLQTNTQTALEVLNQLEREDEQKSDNT